MSDDQRRTSERRPVALQVRLGFGDVGEFVERYATNISDGGIFIRSREPRPIGSKLSFELRLKSGELVFSGEGTVRWRQLPDARGLGAAGMGLQFDRLTDESRSVLERILHARDESRAPPPVDGARPESWVPLDQAPPPPERTPPPEPSSRPPPVLVPGQVARGESAPPPPPAAPSAVARVQLQKAPPRPVRRAHVGLEVGWGWVRLALCEDGESTLLSFGGLPGVPALAAERSGEPLVGVRALQAVDEGARRIPGVVQLLGRHPEAATLAPWRRRQLAGAVGAEDGRAGVQLAGQVIGAQRLVERLLREAKEHADAQLGPALGHAVLSVPAGLGDVQRRALRRAATAAGFSIEQLVPAPAAACLAIHGGNGRRRVLTVDFGAGRFEAAVVQQDGNVFDLVASASDDGLGSSDLDAQLVGHLLTQFEAETGLLVPEDEALFERVRRAAERTKELLGEQLEHEVVIPDLVAAGIARAELRQRVSRARLWAMAQPLVERAVELIRQTLAQRQLGPADLDEVILIGAGGRLGVLARKLAERLGKEPLSSGDTLGAAARGAAQLAAAGERLGGYVTTSAVGQSVGVGLPGGAFKRVLDRGLSLPAERSYTATTTADGQRQIELCLFQGEAAKALDNDFLGTLVAGPLAPQPKGQGKVALQLAMNEEGLVDARGRDLTTGREVPVTIDRTRTLDAARRALETR